MNLKIKEIRKAYCKTEPSFIFFTDTHWGVNRKKSTYIIQHILERTNIDKVFFGGDFVTHVENTKEEACQLGRSFMQDFSFVKNGFYCIYGNHDNNSYHQLNVNEILTDDEVANILRCRPLESTRLVAYDNFTYYFDVLQETCRYIILNTAKGHICNQEIKFVADALNVSVGFKIIILAHIWLEWNGVDHVPNEDTLKLFNIFDTYNERDTWHDFDFSNAKGKIVLLLGGHVHYDRLKYTEGGIPIITCNADCDDKACGTMHYKNHPKEQCVTVFCFNNSGNVNLIRIGKQNKLTTYL